MRSKEFNPLVSFPLSDSNSKNLVAGNAHLKDNSSKKKAKSKLGVN